MKKDEHNQQLAGASPIMVERTPVFPLPIFMLCGGMQRLRIFEQKYLDMVAHCEQTQGFVISLPTTNTPYLTTHWGAHVCIEDFGHDDGVLTIDVQADRLVTLSDFNCEQDGLLTAKLINLDHWSALMGASKHSEQDQQIHYQLSLLLKSVFGENNEFNRLYKSHYFEYPEWVCARLLEIVPIPLKEKAKFIQVFDFSMLIQFLSSLCEQHNNKNDPL